MENKDLDHLLSEFPEEQEPEEDLMIHQPDGSRACLNWELRGRGYHMVNDSEKNYSGHEEISDEELLKEAYRDLNNYNSKKENL